jgi:hypothetical protein
MTQTIDIGIKLPAIHWHNQSSITRRPTWTARCKSGYTFAGRSCNRSTARGELICSECMAAVAQPAQPSLWARVVARIENIPTLELAYTAFGAVAGMAITALAITVPELAQSPAAGILAAVTTPVWAYIGYRVYRTAEYQDQIDARLAAIALPTPRRCYTYTQHLAYLASL